MKCKYCEKELTGRQENYCSNKCRMAYNRALARTSITKQKLSVRVNGGVRDNSVRDNVRDNVSKLSRDQLYAKIHGYPANTWKDSPEYAELIRRLKTMSLSELEVQGYQIPNWKAHGLPCPIRVAS